MKLLYTKFLIILLLLFSGVLFSQSNQYLHFDGIDDYTELANAASYVNGKNTITMAGWFYTDELIYGQGMMSIRGGGTGSGEMYLIQLDNGTLECRVVTTTGLHQVVGPAGTIQAGVWQHIAWIFNQNTVQLYVNGILVGSNSASGTFLSTNKPFSIGKSILAGFNFIYKGRADEVSLWSKALTAVEIQDMIANELNGDETDLQVYYKFNQGTPGGNNTNITQLNEFSGNTSKNSVLHNFALFGETSNFNGILEDGNQTINFPLIPNKLITDVPFELEATTNSGLPVSFELISGPASISGTTLTLNGTVGTVIIKASQAGNEDYEPAEDVTVAFEVLDPNTVLVNTEILHPISAYVYAPSLMPIKIAIRAGIEYDELFSIDNVTASVDGNEVELENHQNGFYTGWWTPQSYGNHELTVSATNNFGVQGDTSLTFNLQQNTPGDVTVNGTTQAWVKADVPVVIVESNLPSHIGAYDQILGTLIIDCPTGGCDPWDRVSSVEVQGKDGKWFEIIRYLTPYGVACQSDIDLTDFASLLSGKTKFRVTLTTQGNGFLYTLQLNYKAGTATYPYSNVEKLWYDTYQFGDMANLQPTEQFTGTFAENTATAKIKLISSGHGWGENNTSNAAEFLANTHHIWVNNQQAFSQFNWKVCNPNPDGCSPQAGTWMYNRAGWCPGSIAQFFDYSLAPYTNNDITLDYKFDQSYVDYCHPNNPNCVTGQTCNDCNDGFNPHLIVTSYLISFGNAPLGITLGIEEQEVLLTNIKVYPNPSTGNFFIDFDLKNNIDTVTIYDITGRVIKSQNVNNFSTSTEVNLYGQAKGVYLVKLSSKNNTVDTKRIIIE